MCALVTLSLGTPFKDYIFLFASKTFVEFLNWRDWCVTGAHNTNITKLVCLALIQCIIFLKCNTLRPRQNGRHFADDTFKPIFMNENGIISINISLKFVPKGLINNIPALVQIMVWRRPGDKPLSEPMMVNLLTHICVTRPQWVNGLIIYKLTQLIHTARFYNCLIGLINAG